MQDKQLEKITWIELRNATVLNQKNIQLGNRICPAGLQTDISYLFEKYKNSSADDFPNS